MKKIIFYFVFFSSMNVSAGLNELEMIGVSLAAGIGTNVAMTKLFKKKCAVTAGWGCMAATMTASTAVQQLISYGLAKDSSEKYRCEGCYDNDWDPWNHYDLSGNNQENDAYNTFKGKSPSILGNPLTEGIDLKENERVSPSKVFKHLLGKTPEEIQSEIQKDLKDLKKKGYAFKGSKLQTPNGLVDPKNLTTDAGLKAAGLSEDEIAAFNEAKKEAEAISKRTNVKVRRGLKRGTFIVRGNQRKDADSKQDRIMEKYLRDLLQKKNESTASSVVSLSKKHGQDTIGVKSNDIFEMVSRRYEAQRRENHFLPVPRLQSKKSPGFK